MRHNRPASFVLLAALVVAATATASAQAAPYYWAKYTLAGYGALDMGFFCDNGTLNVAVHGEAKGTLSVSLGDAPQSATFDGSNGMGPDGYYTQAVVRRSVSCDQRGSWPPVSITSSTGRKFNVRWQ